jgi:hypothetical protein
MHRDQKCISDITTATYIKYSPPKITYLKYSLFALDEGADDVSGNEGADLGGNEMASWNGTTVKFVSLYLTMQLKVLLWPSTFLELSVIAFVDSTSRHCLHLSGGKSHVHCVRA